MFKLLQAEDGRVTLCSEVMRYIFKSLVVRMECAFVIGLIRKILDRNFWKTTSNA